MDYDYYCITISFFMRVGVGRYPVQTRFTNGSEISPLSPSIFTPCFQ